MSADMDNQMNGVPRPETPIADKVGLQPNQHRWRHGDIVFLRGTELDIANAFLVVETNVIAPAGQIPCVFLSPYFQRVSPQTQQLIRSDEVRLLPQSDLYHYSEFGLRLQAPEYDQYLQYKQKQKDAATPQQTGDNET